MLGGWWFVLHAVRHPLNELALIRRAHIAPGFIVNAGEDVDFGDRNEAYWTHWVSYTYRTPDGREFTHHDSSSGRLPDKLRNLDRPYGGGFFSVKMLEKSSAG